MLVAEGVVRDPTISAKRYGENGSVSRNTWRVRPSAAGSLDSSALFAITVHAAGRGDGQAVARLDVGLVEAREEPVRLVRLEVRVEVLLAVLRVDELVEAVAVVVVVVLVLDADDVGRGERVGGEREPVAGPVGLRDRRRRSPRARAMRFPVWSRKSGLVPVSVSVSAKRRVRSPRYPARPRSRSNRDVVGDVGDACGARGGLVLGQNVAAGGARVGRGRCGGHAGLFRGVARVCRRVWSVPERSPGASRGAPCP